MINAEIPQYGAKLEPAGIQLTPLFQILILPACPVIETLCAFIPLLHAEAADIHAPVGDAGEGEVESGRDLCFHILPAGADVAAPDSGGVALYARKAGAGEEEHPFVGIHAVLAIVDRFGVHPASCSVHGSARSPWPTSALLATFP